ncbi:uncharacterized protein BJ171DRAFT_292060 [Polychytrium aggregatum]|uniref:uncharacterized protein n=1 Tax=Polychytrium aggregatum TaxID=110093 RepID=UPI0022FEF781|nr:uncharacterized protein BJ171DRAFT_292060 [Polychytrium aggregatum]KAI9207130.1 hypothetical protein BJ171DRAFT_292060 [Polychytrium aggregatum]
MRWLRWWMWWVRWATAGQRITTTTTTTTTTCAKHATRAVTSPRPVCFGLCAMSIPCLAPAVSPSETKEQAGRTSKESWWRRGVGPRAPKKCRRIQRVKMQVQGGYGARLRQPARAPSRGSWISGAKGVFRLREG